MQLYVEKLGFLDLEEAFSKHLRQRIANYSGWWTKKIEVFFVKLEISYMWKYTQTRSQKSHKLNGICYLLITTFSPKDTFLAFLWPISYLSIETRMYRSKRPNIKSIENDMQQVSLVTGYERNRQLDEQCNKKYWQHK